MNNTKYFECDCFDREHMIIARYDEFTTKFKDNTSFVDRSIILEFQSELNENFDINETNLLKRLIKKIIWRIKNSFKIMFYGRIKTIGYYVPCRSVFDNNKDNVENLFGYKTTKELAGWLNDNAEKIKNEYELYKNKKTNNN